jgi:membrane-bound lytic murein transglycosylase D
LTNRHLLGLGRVLAVTALVLPVPTIWHGGSELAPLKAQVWSAPTMQADSATIPYAARIELGVDSQVASLPLDAVTYGILLFFAASLVVGLAPLLSEACATWRAIRDAHVLRQIGHVRLLISEKTHVPFAAWTPKHAFVVLPAALLLRPEELLLALRHEGQHHRHGDTRYLYALLLGRALFGINPGAHWLMHQLSELQEFACDEAIARRASHCARRYSALLLRIAEAALPARHTGVRAFMASHHAFALARRIEAALRPPACTLKKPAAIAITCVAVALLAAMSASIATPIQDRRLSLEDAKRLAVTAQISASIPITVNEDVLAQLNLLLGTPDGRAFLRGGLARMQNHESSIRAELHRYGLPSELLAVPLVESGYQNLRAKTSEYPGVGLWMFIGRTARYYGLRVSAEHDERLDVPAETGAAMRMFSDLQHRFGDWPLALMAYNTGVSRVEAGIGTTHSRDAWTLYQAGYGNEPHYLARVMAVILILGNPELVR